MSRSYQAALLNVSSKSTDSSREHSYLFLFDAHLSAEFVLYLTYQQVLDPVHYWRGHLTDPACDAP